MAKYITTVKCILINSTRSKKDQKRQKLPGGNGIRVGCGREGGKAGSIWHLGDKRTRMKEDRFMNGEVANMYGP